MDIPAFPVAVASEQTRKLLCSPIIDELARYKKQGSDPAANIRRYISSKFDVGS